MIGVDTNVLLRLFANDEPAQTRAALDLLSRSDQVRVVNIVLVELVWTLSRRYRLDRRGIADVIQKLLQQSNIVVENRGAVGQALEWFARGRADFADYLIAALNSEAGASPTYTFDQAAAEHPAFELIASQTG